MKQIPAFKSKFAIHLENLYSTVDGVDIHHTESAGIGLNRLQNQFIGANENDFATMRVSKCLDLIWAHSINLLEHDLHICGSRIAQEYGYFLAVGPVLGGGLQDFGEIGGAERARTIGLINNYGDVASCADAA